METQITNDTKESVRQEAYKWLGGLGAMNSLNHDKLKNFFLRHDAAESKKGLDNGKFRHELILKLQAALDKANTIQPPASTNMQGQILALKAMMDFAKGWNVPTLAPDK